MNRADKEKEKNPGVLKFPCSLVPCTVDTMSPTILSFKWFSVKFTKTPNIWYWYHYRDYGFALHLDWDVSVTVLF